MTTGDRPLRIGIVTPGFSASEEDWCLPFLLDLVRVLAREHEVTVYPLRYPHRRSPYQVYGATVRPEGWAGRRGPLRLLLLARARRRLVRLGRGLDLLHAMWAHESGFVAMVAGRTLGCPVVVSLLGGELVDLPQIDYGGGRRAANRWLVRRALAGATLVLVGSKGQETLAAAHLPRARIRRWPLGVDTELFRPDGDGTGGSLHLTGDPVIIHVASLTPVKDQETLLRAFAVLLPGHAGAVLHVVGEGDAGPALEQRASALGLGERVRFHGAVRRERLPDLYRQADLAVLSSRFESTGMVVLEAAACGTPTVGTAVGILPELEGGGRWVTPGDPGALAAALDGLLREPDTISSMGRSAAALVHERYGLEASAAALVSIYRELL